MVRGDHSGEVSDSDSDSESGPGSCSDSDLHKESISGSEHSSEKCKVSLKQSYNFINYLNPITCYYSRPSDRCISVFLYSCRIDGFTEERCCFHGL